MMTDMTISTLYTLLLLGIPFVAALSAYGMLRNRDRGALAAGCAAIVVGVFMSFAISAIYFLLAVT